MNEFVIPANYYLKKDTRAFYHVPYVGMRRQGNPHYLNDLKNTFNSFSDAKLGAATEELKNVFLGDLPKIINILKIEELTVCSVPRSKAENSYRNGQLLFKSTLRSVVSQLNGFKDGTGYLLRHTNTKTTHFRNPVPNYCNDGKEPYLGITADTCHISKNVEGKNILLVDDIYTPEVNIDEDAIQSLIDAGAYSVYFYAIAKT